MNYLLSLILFLNFSIGNQIVPLQITIDEVRSQKGNISVSVFLDQESFTSEKPYFHKIFSKLDHIEASSFVCSIELPQGDYGIVILDDENGDSTMNYNWAGIPKEGYGFSNFVHKGFSKPVYSDFMFNLNQETKKMNITLRYF